MTAVALLLVCIAAACLTLGAFAALCATNLEDRLSAVACCMVWALVLYGSCKSFEHALGVGAEVIGATALIVSGGTMTLMAISKRVG